MNDKKTICFISKYATWQDYRNEVLTCLGRRFSADVEMLTTGKLKPYLHDNDIVKYKFFRSWVPLAAEKLGFFPGAVWHIFKNRPHVVLCQNDTRQFTEYLAFLICKILHIRFVWWTHSHMPSVLYRSYLRKWLRQKYALHFLKKADAVITYCEIGRNYLLENGLDKRNIYCAPNTLDTDKLLTQAEEIRRNFTRRQLVEKLNLPESAHYLLYMGRLTARKNIDQAIRLAGKLNEDQSTRYHIIIIGDGPFRQELENYAQKKAAGCVTFTGAIFEDKRKALYFSIADLFVIPGAVGLAIIYAFAFRLPVLTTNVPHHGPEIIYLKNGKNGFICDRENIGQMAAHATELLQNPEQREKMAACAERTLRQKADIQMMTAQMAKALSL